MANPLLQQYIKVTEFLGLTLGPDYEVALHDMTDKNRSIIAIANNHISGRDVGAPLTNVALKILMDRSYETQDYRLHYCGMSAKGKVLHSSTMFIKQNGKLIGMLCINFDDSKYREASDAILKLCHPDRFVEAHVQIDESQFSDKPACPPAVSPESFHNSIGDVAEDGRIHIEQRNKFTVGEQIEIMKPNGDNIVTTVLSIRNDDGEEMESAPHSKQSLWVLLDRQGAQYDLLRRKE